MIKLNVKSLILALCVLGGMVTTGVASAIPERYIITGGATGFAIGASTLPSNRDFYNHPFTLQLDIDSDLLADPKTFEAFMEIEQIGSSNMFQYNGQASDPDGLYKFDVSRSVYSEGGLIISRLIADVFDPSAYGNFQLDIRLLPDGGVFGSDFNFSFNGHDVVRASGHGNVSTVTRVALPTPSSALLMLPLLLFVFRRSLLNRFNTFKPVRALAA